MIADSTDSTKTYLEFSLRNAQGGYADKRSDLNQLGGGQLALEVKYSEFPLSLCWFGEYYTNSPNPTHNYEIRGMGGFNVFYSKRLLKNRKLRLYAGGGTGGMDVPRGEDYPGKIITDMFYNIEAGASYTIFWKLGLYGFYKYLYADEHYKGKHVIEFHEHIIMVGITLDFKVKLPWRKM